MNKQQPHRLLIVTGLSGAGKSTVLRNLEDIDYEVIDNIPLKLLHASLEENAHLPKKIALGIDARNRDYDSPYFIDLIKGIKKLPSIDCEILFLDCQDDVLIRRFSETRRRHPINQHPLMAENIRYERKITDPIRPYADYMMDSSQLSLPDLRRWIQNTFRSRHDKEKLAITIRSFSYKTGIPKEADIVMDVRFLHNPYYEKPLRDKNGTDATVGDYIQQDNNFRPFYENFCSMMLPLIECYQEEGKSYLTIAFGCTGGKHRSVFLAEKFTKKLQEEGFDPSISHRDMVV